MEIVEGKSTDKKIVIAQEIAFAKVLAGNNKTLRDRAVKKLKRWLTIRGNGKWTFTEDEFIRIWTGLFYCMWMSDKFLIQEELAESISNLIHCFKKNSDTALLFVKCFHKRILMDWEGLDQYRIDKFNMLVRRFLRQTFVYCKQKDWEESLVQKLMGIFFNVVLHRDNSLGFVLHFISIYAEELAKVSKGKLETGKVLQLIEPFVKLIARSKDARIQKEAVDFFYYLMKQTDTGIEFEEKFNAWKEQGYPGEGPQCLKAVQNGKVIENGNDLMSEDEDEDEDDTNNEILDPRAGSVHVFLPQIPLDIDGVISLFQKHQNSKQAGVKGRRILRDLTRKYESLKRGRFPFNVKKDPIITERPKKKQTLKNAAKLLEYTDRIDEGPVKTKEFKEMSRELEELDESADEGSEDLSPDEIENEDIDMDDEIENEDIDMDDEILEAKPKTGKKNKNEISSKKTSKLKKKKVNKKEAEKIVIKEKKTPNGIIENKVRQNGNLEDVAKDKKKKGKNRKKKEKKSKQIIAEEEIVLKPKKKQKIPELPSESQENKNSEKVTPIIKAGSKRKILSNWQVQELDASSPEYYKIETPKIIRIERKIGEVCSCEENENEKQEEVMVENEWKSEKKSEETPKEEVFPVFWEKARAKVVKKSGSKGKLFANPLASLNSDSRSPARRISFALDKNMAQENEQYLEEVKNSPRVPFDGSKKPVQSALKSGLAPSPVNPFYRFKKIKF